MEEPKGILRLRARFASRRGRYAQDDKRNNSDEAACPKLLRAGRIARVGIRSRGRIGGRGWAVRCGGHGLRSRRVRHGRHSALRVQKMVLARPQAQFDQSARVRHGLALPSVIGLVAAHGVFARLVPGAGRFSVQVVFADQRFLDGLRSLGVNFLLAAADASSARSVSPSRPCGSCRRWPV